MTTYNLTATPRVVVMELRGNTATYSSPLTAATQTIDRGGLKWAVTYTYTELRGDDRADTLGNIAAMRAQANRLRVSVYDNPKRGNYGGTPLVVGGGQTGSTLNIDGCSNTVTNWIRKGDYFSVEVNGEHELKMATADASSNGTGQVTLTFEPRLRFSPLTNAPVFVEDGSLSKPQGIFMLAEANQNWSSQPGILKRTSISLSMIEDVFATQP